MRYGEIKEYNSNGGPPSTPSSILMPRLKKSIGPVEVFSVGVGGRYYIYFLHEGNSAWYFISNESKSSLIGYMRIEHIVDDIWQVKEVSVDQPNLGLGSSLYYFAVRIGNSQAGLTTKKLINDTQLSKAAEKVWNSSIFKKGLNRKIYDKYLNKIYDENQIGELTSDGTIILNPKEDTTDLVTDVTASDMRFFWLAENEHPQIEFSKLRYRCLTEEFTEEIFQEILRSPNSSSYRWAYKWVDDGEF